MDQTTWKTELSALEGRLQANTAHVSCLNYARGTRTTSTLVSLHKWNGMWRRPCHGSGSHLPVSRANNLVRSQASAWSTCVGRSGGGTGFSASTSGSPVSAIPSVLLIHSLTPTRITWFSQRTAPLNNTLTQTNSLPTGIRCVRKIMDTTWLKKEVNCSRYRPCCGPEGG